MIHIGVVTFGPELERAPVNAVIDQFLTALRAVEERAGPGATPQPSVDIVAIVPGSLGGPDFEGIRLGRVSRKQRIAQVEIAIDAAQVYEPDQGALFGLIRSATLATVAKLNASGLPADEAYYRRVLDTTAGHLEIQVAEGAAPIADLGGSDEIHGVVILRVRHPQVDDVFDLEEELIRVLEQHRMGTYEGNEVGDDFEMSFASRGDPMPLAKLLAKHFRRLKPAGASASMTIVGPDGDETEMTV